MQIEKRIPLLEKILSEWKEVIGSEYDGYKNHVYRMVQFCFVLRDCSDEEKEKIVVAAVFHDLGIWIDNTLDYLPPSVKPALEYLKDNDHESWSEEIELMITNHHKIRKYRNEKYPLVEVFRKADLVDLSRGFFKLGISKEFIKQVIFRFPNAGFHENLKKRAIKWCIKHPLNPVPMMKL